MKRVVMVFLLAVLGMTFSLFSQKSVAIDGRLQPILDEFLEACETYGIEHHEKLFQLKEIDISNTLPLEEGNTVLGMVTRDTNGEVENILISWAAMLDPEILKVVAFHEFAHHFLDYKHSCQECNEIMAVVNTSYFDIVSDWENQVDHLFTTSPVYRAKQKKHPVVSISME